MNTWQEYIQYFESLKRTETDPDMLAYYDRVISLWVEVGYLKDLRNYEPVGLPN
jgi:hypothetical protein